MAKTVLHSILPPLLLLLHHVLSLSTRVPALFLDFLVSWSWILLSLSLVLDFLGLPRPSRKTTKNHPAYIMAAADGTRPLSSCSQASFRTTPTSGSDHTTCRYPTHPSSPDLPIPAEDAPGNGGVSSYLDGLPIDGVDVLNTLDSMAAFKITPAAASSATLADPDLPRPSLSSLGHGRTTDAYHEPLEYKTPFHKWMRTLRKRARQRPRSVTWGSHLQVPSLDGSVAKSRRNHHAKSSSASSSYAFVAAVRSASGSLASASAVTRQRRTASRSHTHTRTERSSRASFTAARLSEDSGFGEHPAALDPAAADRSLQRRRILEELINTEEGYIRDVRFLMNVSAEYRPRCLSTPAGVRG